MNEAKDKLPEIQVVGAKAVAELLGNAETSERKRAHCCSMAATTTRCSG